MSANPRICRELDKTFRVLDEISRQKPSRWNRWTVTFAFVTLAAFVGCSGGNPPQQDSQPDAAPDAAETSFAQWVLGEWQIAAENGTGSRLTIALESATGTTVSGRVMRFMSGNAGVGPSEFSPFSADTNADGSLRLTLEMVDAPPTARIELDLARSGDELQVRAFEMGGQDMTANDRVWMARRIE